MDRPMGTVYAMAKRWDVVVGALLIAVVVYHGLLGLP